MNITECIKTRRSIRRYKAEPVDHSIIDSVVSSASYSPSWKSNRDQNRSLSDNICIVIRGILIRDLGEDGLILDGDIAGDLSIFP